LSGRADIVTLLIPGVVVIKTAEHFLGRRNARQPAADRPAGRR
jgi:hypothetical protein